MTRIADGPLLKHALAYARLGWRVFPLHSPTPGYDHPCSCGKKDCSNVGKHPRTEHGLNDASDGASIIRDWWRQWPMANVGLATGASGIVALDVDGDKGGRETLADLIAKYGEIPNTPRSLTGDGFHILFARPNLSIRNSTEKLGMGLDIRGDGGYIVAPPSMHALGIQYRWVADHDPGTPLASMPRWMIDLLAEMPKPQHADRPTGRSDAAQHWLGKALAKANLGNRNDTGHWLACQLRDAGVSNSEAEATMVAYASRCPQGSEPYTDREAIATWKSTLSRPPRSPAVNLDSPKADFKAVQPHLIPTPKDGASVELSEWLTGVIEGRIFNAPWPWELLTRLTQSLIPGSVTLICGEPGVGKTFLVLDCFQFWHGNGFKPSVFFVEKNRRFHTMRLLAQLEGDGRFIELDWIKKNATTVSAAMKRHESLIDEIGTSMFSAPPGSLSFELLIGWMKDRCKDGSRILVIDPITAADAGEKRWSADQNFMNAAQQIMTEYGASLVLVTHPKKGTRFGAASGHDMAGGAAFYRFADSEIWLHKSKSPKPVVVKAKSGYPEHVKTSLFFQLHKTRDGKGSGLQLAYSFGDGLHFAELGVVTKWEMDGDE